MPITRGTKATGTTEFESGFTILSDEVNTDFNTVYSGVNNIAINDSNVSAGANIDPSKIGDYSASAAEMRTQTNPLDSTTWTETGENEPTDLEGELARIRYVIQKAFGGTYWFSRANHGFIAAQTGMTMPYLAGTTPPTGWILWNDGTIGNGSSSASNRANADTVTLFTAIYNTYTSLPVFDSAGALVARGADAATDYAANRRLQLPYVVGRTIGVSGTAATGTTATTVVGNRGDVVLSGTATAGGAANITLANNASAPTKNDVLNNYIVRITGGTGTANEIRTVSGYVASTRVVTVSVAWTTAPDNTTTYEIYKIMATRANGDSSGREELIPSVETTAAHTHAIEQGGDDASATGADIADQSAGTMNTNSTGTGSAFTLLQPTIFVPWIIKL